MARPRVFTDLNLNGQAPARAQPKIGEWGPVGVPTTRSKKWFRLWSSLVFVAATAALFGLGWYVWTLIH
ncbi:MAG TPA: hypothetical protein PKM36_11005 [Propionibacteriaceae bacterium]|nr:hypothetical protein [Propionibacteriaceae bacterium]HPZ49818.1 hypothetical protein [Propionibacteriaceae bacterium]HQE31830.1 hypothetical protein [Propionibacteriaceae bacterium]